MIPSRSAWFAAAGLIGIAAALQAAGPQAAAALRYDRAAVEAGEWWRLLSAHWVHLSSVHLLLNAIGLAVLALLCPQTLQGGAALLRLAAVALGVGLGLHLWTPQVDRYVGLSGLLYGLFVLGLLPAALRRDRIAVAALLAIAGHVAWGWAFGPPAAEERLIGGRVIVAAHLWGALSGLLLGLTPGGKRPRLQRE